MARATVKTITGHWRRLLTCLGITPLDKFSPSDLPRGIILGAGCRFLGIPRIRINQDAEIVCGNGVVFNSDPRGYHSGMSFPVTLLADQPGARISIGDESRLHGCCVHAWTQVSIGRACLLAANSQVLDSHGHATELQYARNRTKLQDAPQPIIIGDYCWIGLGALIFKGVTLGEGSVVAAYSVVMSGEYPAFSLLAGSPAKIVRTLPETDVLPENYSFQNADLDGKKIYTY
jgi:acetyltransferase-like isoleucine patch superfamily enzyme